MKGKAKSVQHLTIVKSPVTAKPPLSGARDLPKAGKASHFEILFENANDAMLVVDLEHLTVTDVNSAALDLTGYLKVELLNHSLDALFPSEERIPSHSQGLQRLHFENSGFFEDIVLVAKDRRLRFVSLSVRALEIRDKHFAMCILRDVSEKKNMERDLITKHTELRNAYVSLEKANVELKAMQETLVQSGKLAALGELAAGIAHELNQPLTAIKGFSQESRAIVGFLPQSESKNALSDYIGEIEKGADKMERIISHLRNFTRKSTQDFEWTDVNSVIEESLLMLNKQLKSRGIAIELSFGANLPKIYCNPFQLEQVFINLATNARDAIEAKKGGAGKLAIKTSWDGEKLVEIQYEDNGCGIDEAAKGKIFNPFYTTKEVGKGMGLGLSISYGILARINASILVESTAGKGTTFTIKLPVDYRQH